MATSKAITPSTIHGWLASLGYLFPSSEGELARFEKLHAEMVIPEDELLDPDVIMGYKSPIRRISDLKEENNFDFMKMAARKGAGNIPEHILRKMQNNHKKPDSNNDGPEDPKAD